MATDTAPMSPGQRQLWLASQLPGAEHVYNVVFPTRLRGRLDPDALARSFDAILTRHSVLRSSFDLLDQAPIQRVHAAGRVPVVTSDVSDSPDPVAAARALIELEARTPFDLTRPPLLRVRVTRLGVDDHAMAIVVHHIAFDAWSLAILKRELTALYDCFARGRSSPLPPLTTQYADFAAWQHERLRRGELRDELAYWQRALDGLPSGLPIPADRPWSRRPSFDGATHEVPVPASVDAALHALARKHRATSFMVGVAALQVLLHRYGHETDFGIGTPVTIRSRQAFEGLIGYFLNTLVLRADLAEDPSFETLLQRTRRTAIEAYAHQELPYETLIETLNPRRSSRFQPLVRIMAAHRTGSYQPFVLRGLSSDRFPWEPTTPRFDFSLSIAESAARTTMSLQVDTDRFDAATAERMAGGLLMLLHGIADDPGRPVSRLPLLADGERGRMVPAGGRRPCASPSAPHPAPPSPTTSALASLFTDVARGAPARPALVAGGRWMRYRELDRRSDALAARLLEAGAGPERTVAVALRDGVEQVVAMVAVWKTGAAQLLLDPSEPIHALRWISAAPRCQVAVAAEGPTAELVRALGVPVVEPRGERHARPPTPRRPAGARRAACVVPAGDGPGTLVLEEAALLAGTSSLGAALGLEPGLQHALTAPPHSPAAIAPLVLALTTGGTVHLPGDAGLSNGQQAAASPADQVDVAWIVPDPLAARSAQPPPAPPPPRCALVLSWEPGRSAGGRDLPAASVACRTYRLYGGPETAFDATVQLADPGRDPDCAAVPMGEAVPGVRIYLLDEGLAPVPDGAVGRVFVAGQQLGRGYTGAAGRTAAAFLPDPFGPAGARMYRTDDLARLSPACRLEYLGPIEPGMGQRAVHAERPAIEAAVATHPGVAQVALTGSARGGDLAALIVPWQGVPITEAELRAICESGLPPWLVPARFAIVDALPHLPDGRLDRPALPAVSGVELAGQDTGDRHPLTDVLLGIVERALGIVGLDPANDFFDVGGGSLAAMRLVAQLHATLGVQLDVGKVYDAPSLAALLALVEAELGRAGPGRYQPITRTGEATYRASFAQEGVWLRETALDAPGAFHVPVALELHGEVDRRRLAAAVRALGRRHAALRSRFHLVSDGVVVDTTGSDLELGYDDVCVQLDGRAGVDPDSLVEGASGTPFDLATGPVARASLVRIEPARHLLVLTLHHIVTDAWSIDVLLRDLAAFYAGDTSDAARRSEHARIEYGDFATWQRAQLQGDRLDVLLAYWKKTLAGAPTLLDLPPGLARPDEPSSAGSLHRFSLSRETTEALRAVARGARTTLFMTVLASLYVLLHGLTGADDILIGVPVSGRSRRELSDLVGLFVNPVAIRARLRPADDFPSLVDQVRDRILESYAHADLPFEVLIQELRPARGLGHHPLFQVACKPVHPGARRSRWSDVTARRLPAYRESSEIDLSVTMFEHDALELTIEHVVELFPRAFVDQLAHRWAELLAFVTRRSTASVREIVRSTCR